eukprot:gnl/Dysnectes_brevis/2024_a2334_1089.p1 GENE.gnl/Dysnectes_brevis/2024_a2334_1089~~gnl/Dysnectes_brevis/2024_a2334_1089.p1  ORF type:complete len:325 (+),score=85.01 gnl/Dysnectes_brevis/2024_a2334_1089:31-975(+)
MASVVLVTGGYDHSVKFWEAANEVCYRTINFNKHINSLTISPDKQFLVVAGSNAIKVYDINTSSRDHILSFEGHTANVTSVGFHRTGRWIYSSSEDGTVRVWDVRTGSVQRTYHHGAAVNECCLLGSKSVIVAGDQQGMVKFWDITKEAPAQDLPVFDFDVGVRSVSSTPSGSHVAVCNALGVVEAYQVTRGSPYGQKVASIQAHADLVSKVRFSPDGRFLASCSADHTCKIWNVGGEDYLSHRCTLGGRGDREGHSKWVWDCAFSADSLFVVTASSDQTARLWNLARAKPIRQYSAHSRPVIAVALSDAPDPT